MQYTLYMLCLIPLLLVPQEWEFEVVQPQQVQEVTVVGKEYYVTMFTASYCSQCISSKRDDIPTLKAAMPRTILVDVEKKPEWTKPKRIKFKDRTISHDGIRLLPTYWLIEVNSNGEEYVVKEWVGRTSSSIILKELPTVVQQEQKAVPNVVDSSVSIYNGKSGSSHQNRRTLINHLLNDGIHRGKHSSEKLNRMTDIELDNLHNQDHN